jgi:hypothetical protein
MQGKKKLFRTLGAILFLVGALVGMVMFVLMNWANFEAYFYFGYSAPADKALTSMRCPLLMTTSETGEVAIHLTNDSELDLAPLIQTEISYFGAATSERLNYPLAAGETVTSENMVFGHLVLARIFVYRAFTLSSYTKTCGTVMVNLPGLTGIQLFIILLVFILVSMTAGWMLWLAGSRPLQTEAIIATRAMSIFTVIVLLGILVGCFGWWVVGLICTFASVLLILVVAVYYIQK